MKTLYKVTAHFGHKSQSTLVYYVVAEDSATAEESVKVHHRGEDYPELDFCHFETIAKTGAYGKPNVLLLS